MATKRDFYEALGIAKGADEAEIKKAYRKKAMKYHPDKFSQATENEKKDAETKFKEINEAYQVLSDPEKKAQYDRFGHAAFEQGGGAAGGFQGGYGGGQGYEGFDFNNFDFGGGGYGAEQDMNDIFSSFFGGRSGRKRGPQPGKDLSMQVEITLEESAEGLEKTIRFARNGKDGVRENVEKKFKIPAGIADGQKLKLANMGDASPNGGPFGDLYIYIKIMDNSLFERDGFDIICKVPISYYKAAVGGELEVPTLYGKKKIKISEGTQTGKRFLLKEMGIINPKSKKKGNQYVEVFVEIPVDLNDEQKEILKEFNDKLKDKNKKIKKSFLERVRDFFKGD